MEVLYIGNYPLDYIYWDWETLIAALRAFSFRQTTRTREREPAFASNKAAAAKCTLW